ncbi:MAG: PAS domain S-box protein, partial [Chloroflexi bacterium]|nr:PAS domain S-box protein [Chloroflexota bacterium]
DNEIGALLTTFNKFVLGVKDADNFLRTVLDSSPTAMIISTISDGMILYANPVAQTMLGRTDTELVGSMIKDFYVKIEDQELLFEISEKNVEIKDHEPLKKQELLAKHKDGTKICIDVSIQLIEYEGNKVLISTFFDLTERKKAEEALRKSEGKHRELNNQLQRSIDSMPTAYIKWDTNNQVVEWNQAAEKIFGYSKEEILGKNAADYIVPEDARHLVGKVLKQLKAGEIAEYSERNNNIRKGGKKISCQWYNTPLVDDESIYGFLTLAQDITKQKQTEENLKKAHEDLELRVKDRTAELAKANEVLRNEISERKEIEKALTKQDFRLIETQKVAKIGNWDLDLTIQKLDWSDETYKLFDKDSKKFTPSFDEFVRLVHPNDLEAMQTKFNDALESDENPYHAEVRIINDSGREWVMEAFGKVIRDENDKALSIFGTAQDVTKRNLVDALQASENRFKRIFEDATDGILLADLSGKFFDCNSKMTEMLEYPKNKILKMSIKDIHPQKDLPYILDKFEKMARGEISLATNIPIKRRNNSVLYADISSTHIELTGERCMMGTFRDMSEYKKIEAQLQQAQKMETIGTLAGGIAHDFNNILFPIVGHAEMLLEDIPNDSPLKDSSNEIYVSALRAK